jgi:hypothetical protein
MKASTMCARMTIAALTLGLAGCGCHEVSGLVRDARTGEPLPNARVQVGDEEGVTNHAGRYELDIDDDDVEDVRVFKTGYEPIETTLPEPSDDDAALAPIELQPLKSTPAPAATGAVPMHVPAAHSDEWQRVPSVEERRTGGLEPDARRAWDRHPY